MRLSGWSDDNERHILSGSMYCISSLCNKCMPIVHILMNMSEYFLNIFTILFTYLDMSQRCEPELGLCQVFYRTEIYYDINNTTCSTVLQKIKITILHIQYHSFSYKTNFI